MFDKILVVDMGSRFAQDTARRVRQAGVFSEVKSVESAKKLIMSKEYKSMIIASDKKIDEYGSEMIEEFDGESLFLVDDKEDDETRNLVVDTFTKIHSNCNANWNIKSFVENKIAELKAEIGDKTVLLALSGGVDSSVAALMLHKAIGKKLTCVFVDHGLLRKDEAKQVVDTFGSRFGLNLVAVNASDRFFGRLADVTNPEEKRKIIGEEFVRVFEDESKKLGEIDFLAQGTIYPDVIESGDDNGKVVKSHHNVGGMPEHLRFEGVIEPLRDLFKDEVRQAGEILGLDHDLVWRQPFPGPGLAVRIVGSIDRSKIAIVQNADAIFREEIGKMDIKPSQYYAALLDIKSVGVRNGERTYGYTIALRAVNTIDFMNAEWVRLPYEVLDIVAQRIVAEVDRVNRVVLDITSKPPATIEWE